MERTTNLQELKDGQGFTWGQVIKIHEVGEYAIVEYHPWKVEGITGLVGEADYDEVMYHYYVSTRDTCHSTNSLDSALAGSIAYKHEGPNSRAADYFIRMLNKGG